MNNQTPFKEEAVPTNYRRFLSYPDAVWMIESGEGAVFAMERTGHLVEKGSLDMGPLNYLGSVKSGSCLFGFDSGKNDKVAILVMTHTKTVWRKYKAVDLQEAWIKDPKLLENISKNIDLWINQFVRHVEYLNFDNQEHLLKVEEETHLSSGDIASPLRIVSPEHKEDILWIEVLEGEVHPFGFEQLKITKASGPYPLTHLSWVSASNEARLKCIDTHTAMKRKNFWQGFNAFQSHALLLVDLYIERKKEIDFQRVKDRSFLDEMAVDHSLKHMASVLHKEAPPQLTTGKDALLRACQLVGNAIGAEFKPLKEKALNLPVNIEIKNLCENAKVQCRHVLLKGEFWRYDSLPLLAFLKEDNRPVALINKNPSKYEIIDPITLKKEPLNEETAKKLSLLAYTFYTPFPEGGINGFSIIKFCLSGRKKEALTITGVGVLGGLLSLVPPYLNKVLFNDVIGAGESDLLWQVIIGFIVIAISTAIFLLARSLTMLRLSQLIDYKVETALWDRILSLPAKFFRQFTVGNLIQRVYSISTIHQLISGTSVKVILSGIFSLFYFFAMLYYSFPLALIALGIIFLTVIVSITCIIFKVSLQRKILAIGGILNGLVVQIISGVGKLRISGSENRAFAHWSKHFTESKRLAMQSQKIQNVVTTMTAVLPTFSSAVLFTAVMAMLETSVAEGSAMTLSVGTLIAFLAAYVPFSQSIFEVSNTLINLVQVIPLWERSRVIFQATPEISSEKSKPGHLNGDLVVEHVNFRYEPESPLVLDKLSLQATPGEFIAIVGPSGCGKSTLVRILLGFEVPESGAIYYNGKDLSSLDLREIRHQIGAVLQNGAIMSGSIYENIVCGGSYTKEQVLDAVKLSGFDEDLKNLPMGLHTVVQSDSDAFSGGQVQRLLIARALISKPKILIFDEATSALDNKTQELITGNLDKLKVTRIVIAHRLTTVRNADKVYVMEAGKVIQTGTFQELAAKEGLFQTMLKRQQM